MLYEILRRGTKAEGTSEVSAMKIFPVSIVAFDALLLGLKQVLEDKVVE